MERRDFLKNATIAGIAGGMALSGNRELFAKSTGYDLVAAKGGEPAAMFDKAIAELGGMKAFVKKNQKVLVKPNIGWDVAPERGGNTNPALVKRIIEHCFSAGAKEVYVFDNTCDNWKSCYSNSGIEYVAKNAGAKVVSGASEKYYSNVTIKKGKSLKSAAVHELVLESDVFINVPILKSHGSTKLTIAMKNLMGIVWDRRYWHRNDLHQCIADYITYNKPTLNIVDAYRVMKRNGPRGVSTDDCVMLKSLVISKDIVAADAASAKIFGMEPKDINYIAYASEMGLGRMDLDNLNIKRIKM